MRGKDKRKSTFRGGCSDAEKKVWAWAKLAAGKAQRRKEGFKGC